MGLPGLPRPDRQRQGRGAAGRGPHRRDGERGVPAQPRADDRRHHLPPPRGQVLRRVRMARAAPRGPGAVRGCGPWRCWRRSCLLVALTGGRRRRAAEPTPAPLGHRRDPRSRSGLHRHLPGPAPGLAVRLRRAGPVGRRRRARPRWARPSRPTSGCGRPTAASTRCRTCWSASPSPAGAQVFLQAAQHSLESGEIVSSDAVPSIPGARRVTYFAATNQDGVGEAITMRVRRLRRPAVVLLGGVGQRAADLAGQRRTGGPGPVQGDDAGARAAQRRRAGASSRPRRASRPAPSWLAVLVVAVLALAVATPALLRRRRDAAERRRDGGALPDRRPQAATRLTISANTAGDVTGSRWPESTRMTSTGAGRRSHHDFLHLGADGTVPLVQHVGDGDAGGQADQCTGWK